MAENPCNTQEIEAGDQKFNAVLLQSELETSLDYSETLSPKQNKTGTVFKDVTVLIGKSHTSHPASSLRPGLTYHD